MFQVLVYFIFLSAVLKAAHPQIAQNDIDYYEKLIVESKAEALTYNLPNDAREYSGNGKPQAFGNFDFIVIGSGSGGSVVASRLSEEKKFNVLLLEAGDFESNFTDIPAMAFFAQGSKYNWNYKTVPQTNACLGLVDQKCIVQRGKGIGGTTIINGLVYSRGSKHDYNSWATDGNTGWSYEEILPYFKKSEKSQIFQDDRYHNTKGYLNVERSNFDSPHLKAFLEANVELGQKILDYNGEEGLGVSAAQFNTIKGKRMSAGKAFIYPALNRTNLKISTNSYVVKILISQNKRAYGVKFIKKGKVYIALAGKEIILSAGVIASPHILMLSGIGPKRHLEEKGIRVIKDLPVGDNYKDHPCFFGISIVTNVSIPIKPLEGYIDDYLSGGGIFGLPGNNAGVGFFKTNTSVSKSADFEIMLISPNRTDEFFQTGFGFTNETYEALIKNLDNPKTFTMYIDVLHPKSTGTLRLNSKDPFEYPIINPNHLQEDSDIDIIYYAINYILELLETNAFKKLNAKLVKLELPACQLYEYLSKPYWYCIIRHISNTLYHPIGTCKMGPDPKTAVVDHTLRVHGIKRLRVADGSAVPKEMAGHPNAPITMLAEKASDMIKNTWLNCKSLICRTKLNSV